MYKLPRLLCLYHLPFTISLKGGVNRYAGTSGSSKAKKSEILQTEKENEGLLFKVSDWTEIQ